MNHTHRKAMRETNWIPIKHWCPSCKKQYYCYDEDCIEPIECQCTYCAMRAEHYILKRNDVSPQNISDTVQRLARFDESPVVGMASEAAIARLAQEVLRCWSLLQQLRQVAPDE